MEVEVEKGRDALDTRCMLDAEWSERRRRRGTGGEVLACLLAC